MELDWSTDLGTFRGNWPVLTLGGSKVSIEGNFQGKGKCASRVVSQDSGGFVIFYILCPWQGEEIPTNPRVNPNS